MPLSGHCPLAMIGPLRSSGWPIASTTRPIRPSPTCTILAALIRLDTRAIFERRVLVQRHEDGVIALESNNLRPDTVAVRGDDLRAGTDRPVEAGDFQHACIVGPRDGRHGVAPCW